MSDTPTSPPATDARSLYEETVRNQKSAASPAQSAFVGANAGSGKTRVLIDRVARLLLTGTPPSKILCITFTKAAAAEMAERLFKLLGEWALLDDVSLQKALIALEGEETSAARNDAALARARRLFARALETPGGLKIQTIHSFCESVLRRFPLEAGAPPGFVVVDDVEAEALRHTAIDLTAGAPDPAIKEAITTLGEKRSGDKIRETMLKALKDPQHRFHQPIDEMLLANTLNVTVGKPIDRIWRDGLANIDHDKLRRLRDALQQGGKTALEKAAAITALLKETDPETMYKNLVAVFLTQEGKPRANVCDNPAKKADPGAEGIAADLQQHIVSIADGMKAAALFLETMAFSTLVQHALEQYQSQKSFRAALDFDDLIAGAQRLLTQTNADWVMYKLDQGIDHILLDEAQDTSPAAWSVIEAPLKEFFSGDGGRHESGTGPRTFFAVGDQKQSIYSFQGADAALFDEKGLSLGKTITSANAAFANLPLTLSFRTTAPVLKFVDALFHDPLVLEGVSNDYPLQHGANRAEEAGLVELWPLTPAGEKHDLKPWDAPLDQLSTESPERRLSQKVAETIRHWFDSNARLLASGKRITPGDILILTQSRSDLFHEMIRALGEAGVPVAGADKLKLLEDQGVADLLSYARAALFDGDDLSLAEVLKSPFFNFTDDGDLFPLAHGRQGTLWATLCKRADERPYWRAAVTDIAAARHIGLHEGAAAFFHHLLETGVPSGRKKLTARLGAPTLAPIEELLRLAHGHELGEARSLRRFIHWVTANAGDVSRDAGEKADLVRVMTTHKSKGLEANIVFILDGHRQHLPTGPLYGLGEAGLPTLSFSKDDSPAVMETARAKEKTLRLEEYRRLLYVAATRARDRLYICGLEKKTTKPKTAAEKTWHALAQDAFDHLSTEVTTPETLWDEPVRRIAYGGPASTENAPPKEETIEAATQTPPTAPPPWLLTPAPTERAPLRLAPSKLSGEADPYSSVNDETAVNGGVASPLVGADRFLRGEAIHKLLELLPEIGRPPDETGERETRTLAANTLLARMAGHIPSSVRDEWREEAFAILDDPTFALAFGPMSRAEAPIAGRLGPNNIMVVGQIDRLAVLEDRILLIDYKTNRPPPARAEDVSDAYLAQMGAYAALAGSIFNAAEAFKGRPIEAAIIWTYQARLMTLPEKLIASALERTVA